MKSLPAKLPVWSVLPLYWLVAFYPFAWNPPVLVTNGARVERGAVRFDDPGVLTGDPEWLDTAKRSTEFFAELAVRAARESSPPACVLSISTDLSWPSLAVLQADRDLVVRVLCPGPVGTPDWVSELRVPKVIDGSRTQTVRVEVSAARIAIAVDGTERVRVPHGRGRPSVWKPGHHLTLGNSAIGWQPWAGVIERATLGFDGRVVDLLDGAVARPERFWRLPEELAWNLGKRLLPWASLLELLANIALFVPLGWLVAARGGRTAWAVSVGLMVSLSMECGQVCFDRAPSLLDLGANTLGAWLGAVVLYFSRSSRRPASRTS